MVPTATSWPATTQTRSATDLRHGNSEICSGHGPRRGPGLGSIQPVRLLVTRRHSFARNRCRRLVRVRRRTDRPNPACLKTDEIIAADLRAESEDVTSSYTDAVTSNTVSEGAHDMT